MLLSSTPGSEYTIIILDCPYCKSMISSSLELYDEYLIWSQTSTRTVLICMIHALAATVAHCTLRFTCLYILSILYLGLYLEKNHRFWVYKYKFTVPHCPSWNANVRPSVCLSGTNLSRADNLHLSSVIAIGSRPIIHSERVMSETLYYCFIQRIFLLKHATINALKVIYFVRPGPGACFNV